MSEMQSEPSEPADKKRIARATKRGLILLITLLIAIILALAFYIGEEFWPVWMILQRTRIIGLVSFALVFVILLSPIIVEFNSNPRHLSGPGKDPRSGSTL